MTPDAQDFARRALTFHDTLVDNLTGDGRGVGYLECSACGAKQELTKPDLVRYFRSGWPTCHGTMSWIQEDA